MSNKEFIKLKVADCWGHKFYVGVGGEKTSITEETKSVTVRWKDGKIQTCELAPKEYSEEVYDHGRTYIVNGSLPMAKVEVNGADILVGLDEFDGVILPCSIDTKGKEFEKVLTLSTAHMPSGDPGFGGLRFSEFEYGFVVWVKTFNPDEVDPEDLPEWLKKAWWYANENGCTLMMFDRDAIKLDELPKWDW